MTSRWILPTLSVGACAGPFLDLAPLDWWAAVLTLGQVVSMQGCSRDARWGWLLALVIQPPWAAYAVATGQYAFLVTTALCLVAQGGSPPRLRHAGAAAPLISEPSAPYLPHQTSTAGVG